MSVKIFFCYAHRDEALLNQLKKHLTPLQRQGFIDWYNRDISAGTEWGKEIDRHLNEAQIILLLVSADFMASDYVYGVEMKRAIERHQRGEAQAIPLILRPCDFQVAPFGSLRTLPKDGKPISLWRNRDRAFDEVVTEIYRMVSGGSQKSTPDIGGEKLDENPSPPIPKTASEEGSRQLNKEPPQAHEVNAGSHLWVLGRILIIVLTFLWVLGAIFTGLSFLASIILPIISGLVLLVGYETWYATKHPSRADDNNGLIHVAKILQPRYLWHNPKLRVGSIILLLILIAGTVYYILQSRSILLYQVDFSP